MFLLSRFASHGIIRVNYAVEQVARVDLRNDATIITYSGTHYASFPCLPVLKFQTMLVG